MTSGAPWSVKGIDPKAREVAKDLARRSGMTLGEWLNRMILEDDQPEDVFSESQIPERPARSYFETPRSDAPARYEAPVHPGDEVGRMAGALDRLSHKIEASEARTGMAISSVEQSVRDALERIASAERDQVAVAARFEGVAEEIAQGQNRLADRFRRLEDEAAGPRSVEALRSLEQALGTVANNLYDGETRTREMLAAVEARVGRIEAEGAPSGASPQIAAEAVVEQVGERLMQAEARTGEALASLQQSFAALDGRLQTVERSPGAADLDRKLEDLAAELTRRVEASRAEMAAQLAAASEGRFDRMERKLGEMSEHVRAAEQRSAQAIEQMGQEVRSVADTLGRRVQASEHRNAEAIEQVGGEMARIAQAVETRLARTDTAHVDALEKLGGEIARITERLAERMANAERRSAQALDDINEQVSRVSDRIHQRQERASDDLVERIRLSEERTARLLEEAREKIDQRLAETQGRLAEAPAARAFSPQDAGAFGPIGFAPAAGFPELGPAEPDSAAPVAAPAASTPITSAFAEAFPAAAFPAEAEPARPAFDASDFEAADEFAADDEFKPAEAFRPAEALREAPAFEAAPAFEPAPEAAPLQDVEEVFQAAPTAEDFDAEFKGAEQETSADDLAALAAVQAEPEPEVEARLYEPEAEPAIEAAAPAPEPAIEFAFDAAEVEEPVAETEPETEPAAADLNAELAAAWAAPDEDAPAEPARPLTTREVIEQARAAARAAAQNGGKHKADKETKTGGSMFSGFGFRPKRRAGSTLNTALLVTGVAAGLTVAVMGMVISQGEPRGDTPDRIAEARARDLASGGEITATEADTTPPGAAPRAAIALAPQVIGPAAGEASAEAAATYERALQGLASGSPSGLDDLKTAANLGYPPAQFHLGKLYQEGKNGLTKDLVEARRWTERAALGGDRTAMHNFALNNYFGEGGPKDQKAAADWFRRAAELGLVDSQYNLGRLYEDGQGVPKNPAEAYKWYLIAGRAGDAGAQASLARVKAQLSPEARDVAERAATGFTPALPTRGGLAAGQPAAPSPSVAMAQRVLTRLSYYSGPVDGAASPALRGALSAYQRDRGLAPTGTLDQATLEQLSVYTR